MSPRRTGPGRTRLTEAQKRDLRHHLREPVLTFFALIALLTINIVTGYLQPFPQVWMLNIGIMVLMIATVLLFSMEVIQEPSLVRFFSVLGFCWVGILVTMTLIDYTTR